VGKEKKRERGKRKKQGIKEGGALTYKAERGKEKEPTLTEKEKKHHGRRGLGGEG